MYISIGIDWFIYTIIYELKKVCLWVCCKKICWCDCHFHSLEAEKENILTRYCNIYSLYRFVSYYMLFVLYSFLICCFLLVHVFYILIRRLSQVAGAKLRDNNPAISDLSDPNRPLKLIEKINELYDNEWTDAMEILETDTNEQMSIENLLKILQVKFLNYVCKTFVLLYHLYQFCIWYERFNYVYDFSTEMLRCLSTLCTPSVNNH